MDAVSFVAGAFTVLISLVIGFILGSTKVQLKKEDKTDD